MHTKGPGVSHLDATPARRRRRSASPTGGQTSSPTGLIADGWFRKKRFQKIPIHDHFKKHFHKGLARWKALSKEAKKLSKPEPKAPATQPKPKAPATKPTAPASPTKNSAKAPSGKLLRSRYTPMDFHRNMCMSDLGDGFLTMQNCSFDDASQLWTIGPGKALQNAKTGKCMTPHTEKECGT